MIKAKTVKILILQGLGMIFFVFLNEPPETHAFRNVGNAGEQFMRREQKKGFASGQLWRFGRHFTKSEQRTFSPSERERERERKFHCGNFIMEFLSRIG